MLQLNWWQLLIAGLLIYGVGLGSSYFLFRSSPSTTVYDTVRHSDTLYVEVPVIEYKDSIKVIKQVVYIEKIDTTGSIKDTSEASSYELYQRTTEDSTASAKFVFRSSTYVFDTGDVYVAHEYNIEPRPLEVITNTDTVYVMKEVEVPAKVPFYEKPAFVLPAGIVIGVGLAITIYNMTKKGN